MNVATAASCSFEEAYVEFKIKVSERVKSEISRLLEDKQAVLMDRNQRNKILVKFSARDVSAQGQI